MTHLLVIRLSALGDIAMLVPVIKALAEQYPDIEVTILSQPRASDLFKDMPNNVLFKAVNTKQQSVWDLAKTLQGYDMVADMHNVWRSTLIRSYLWLGGTRTAYIRKGRLEKWSLTHLDCCKNRQLRTTISRYCDVLQELKLPVITTEPIFTTGTGIGIAPFAAHRGKIYPLGQMEKVVNILSETGERIFLFGGGKEEKHILDEWVKYPNVTNTAGQYSLLEELQLISKLRVMLTMDSANMHLASIAGTRVVSVWGATDPKAGFLGYGQQLTDCISRPMKCRPCSIYGKRKCRYDDYRCMNINPEEIVRKLI